MFNQETVLGSSVRATNYQSATFRHSFMARDVSSLSSNAKKEGWKHPVSIS